MQDLQPSKTLPPFLYGTAWKKEQTASSVIAAVNAGFQGIDTACQPKHYNEAAVGQALKELNIQGIPRERLYLQTKFTPLEGHDPKQIPYNPNASLTDQVAQSFTLSQHNLQTSYVDALLLHTTLFPYGNMLSAWQALETVHDQGGALRLGLSNCYDLALLKRLYEDARVKPSILQNRFYDETGYDTPLRHWCQDHDITYQSFWSLTANSHILASDTLQSLATLYQKTRAQIFFAYLRAVGIVPLTGTSSLEHMREDLQSLSIPLQAHEIESITAVLESFKH